MAYSELIKNFEKVRDYMREFFVYGFKSRTDYDRKSARSYDNERRRIESWMGQYMAFRQDPQGKNVFISVDSRSILHNPLFKAFKAKSFTDNDITLHFFILDLLADASPLSVRQIVEHISSDYISQFPDARELDESTIRKKLKEYEKLGILRSSKSGRELAFALEEDISDPESWMEAAAFYSEAAPMGVIGSTILDRAQDKPDWFGFKHHYILHALDSQILCDILLSIRDHRRIEITTFGRHGNTERVHKVYPMRIYVSTQNGRQHLMCYHYRFRRPMFFRLDNIHSVVPGDIEKEVRRYESYYQAFAQNLWGVSVGEDCSTDHVEMTIYVGDREGFIADRLFRESRGGTIECLDPNHFRFSADVYDGCEMVPWIRTFLGRITDLQSSNPAVLSRVWADLEEMENLYGGEEDAIQ